MQEIYQPSGKFSNLSLLYFILTCIFILPILAFIYSYLIWYVPIVYISFLFTAGFGFSTGLIIRYLVIKLGKIRNSSLALLLGIIGGFITLYISWAVWLDLDENISDIMSTARGGIAISSTKIFSVLLIITDPNLMLETISEINNNGNWSIFGVQVNGIFLSIIWIIEALIVFYFSATITYNASKEPFCELNNRWYDNHILPSFQYIENINEIISDIKNSNLKDSVDKSHLSYGSFEKLKLITNDSEVSHSVFTLYKSKNTNSYLSIENKLASLNNKGKIIFDSDKIIEFAVISEEIQEKIEEKIFSHISKKITTDETFESKENNSRFLPK